MSFLAPAIPALVSSGVSMLGSSLLSRGQKNATSPLRNFRPVGINAGGITSNFSDVNNSMVVAPSEERTNAVGNVAGAFGLQADELRALRPMIEPGVSGFRSARLAEIENARRSAIGNLRENLQRRRVLGSSFGEDALTRAEAEFGQQRERVAAESFLQEFEAKNNLINQEYTARRGQFQTFLDELNLEASLAAGLTGKATEVLGKNALLESQLLALESEGRGKFFGQQFQPVGKAFGDIAGGLFKSALS